MGDKMTDQELDEMLDAADTKHDGMVNYTGLQFFQILKNSLVMWWHNVYVKRIHLNCFQMRRIFVQIYVP